MVNRFQKFLTPPQFADDEKSRVAALLHYILLATIAVNAFNVILLAVTTPEARPGLWINAVLLAVQVGLLALTRRGYVWQSALLLCVAMWVGITVGIYDAGGLLNPNYIAYALIILMAGILLGGYAALGFAVLSIFVGVLLFLNASQGAPLLKQAAPSLEHILTSTSVAFFMLALLLVAASRTINRTLRRARDGEATLNEKNLTLQTEIAERQKAETELRLSQEAARDFQERLKNLHEISVELSKVAALDDLCRGAVDMGRARLGFDRLSLWFWTAEPKIMVGSFGTDEQGNIRDERGSRVNIDDDPLGKKAQDEGLKLVYDRDMPLYNDKLEVVGQGWNAMALLQDGDKQLGWISADNYFSHRPLTDYDLEILALYGSTLGHLCTRKRAEEALQTSEETARDFQERLKNLHEVSVELTKAPSLDALCRQAIELGLERLGYDRLGMWFLTPDHRYMTGMYGTDESGGVRSEQGTRIDISQDLLVSTALREQQAVVGGENLRLTNDRGEVVGHGWNLMAVVRDGEQIIGWISADNFLNKRPLKPSDVEILKLYGTMLGHLSTLKRQDERAEAFQERLKTLHEVGVELARPATVDDLCRMAVELGRGRLGFDRMGIWLLDQTAPAYILGSFGTDESGQTRDERGMRLLLVGNDSRIGKAVEEHSRRIILAEEGEVIFNERSEVVGRGQRAAGLMWDGDELIGYIAIDNFFHKQSITPEDAQILTLYSAMLGQLIRRKRAEDALRANERAARHFQERLRVLHEVGIELTQVRSFDDLCYRAIELGRSRLGFDRLGIWFLDEDDPAYMLGSFGIDEDGHIRDERMMRLRVDSQDARVVQAIEARMGRLFLSDEPMMIYNDKSQIVGQGEKAMALLWEHDDVVGTISTDNLISRQPITEEDLEILTLYGAIIGHLCAKQKAEEALREERNLLRIIIDTTRDYIYVKDTQSRFILANSTVWSNTPDITSEDGMIGKTDFDYLPQQDAEATYAQEQKLFRTGEPILDQEEYGQNYSKNPVTYLTSKIPLRDAQGSIIGLVGVSRDITDLKQAEQERLELALQKERVDLLTEFIGNMSHDLKTPLSVIKTSLYLLERLDDPVRQQAKIETMKDQILLLEKLIQDVLTMSRLEHSSDLDYSPVDLNQLLQDIEMRLRPTAERKNLHTILDLAPDLPLVRGNESELWRMMTNLVENALNYTLENGTITLRTFVNEGAIITDIQDTGIGISPDDAAHIFDRFYRADPARSFENGGTGLGLAIVKRIVEMHGGTVDVQSMPGQGSTFRVRLPIIPA